GNGMTIRLSGQCAALILRNYEGRDAMRVGLLGAGRIGRIHGGNIAAHPRATLAAVADADAAAAEQLAKLTGASVATVEAIIDAEDIAAVFICTPTDTHADLIERATRAGKP